MGTIEGEVFDRFRSPQVVLALAEKLVLGGSPPLISKSKREGEAIDQPKSQGQT
jgi:hypothetical protein